MTKSLYLLVEAAGMEWMVAVDAGLSVDVAEDSVEVSETVFVEVLNRRDHDNLEHYCIIISHMEISSLNLHTKIQLSISKYWPYNNCDIHGSVCSIPNCSN